MPPWKPSQEAEALNLGANMHTHIRVGEISILLVRD